MKRKIIFALALVGLLNFSCEQEQVAVPETAQPEAVTEQAVSTSMTEKLNSIYSKTFTGKGTFYTPTGLGNCMEAYPSSNMYAAMNKKQFDNSNACGSYIEVTRKGTTKKVILKVLDQCPECPEGNVDLSKAGFLKLGNAVEGIIPITWKFIKQPTEEKMAVRIKSGSTKYWFSLQILNHRYLIKKVEIKNRSGAYVAAVRQTYNYFSDNNGVFDGSGPEGPYDIRITDVNGSMVTARINFKVNVIQNINTQFPISK